MFWPNFLTQTTWRITVLVFGALAAALVVTGFVTSAYKHERMLLGQEHYGSGQLLRSRDDLIAATEQYRQALIYSPDDQGYRQALAGTLIDAGHLDEAQAHLEQLIEEDPTNGVLNLMMARVALKRNRTKEAIEYYQRAVYEYWPTSELPERRRGRWELAKLLEKTGNRSGYIAELMQLYAGTNPQQQQQMLEIGARLREAAATSEAVQVFRQVLRNAPENADAYRGLGEVAFDSGDYVSARHDFQRALRIAPHDATTTEKLELTNEIIDLDPQLPDIREAERLRRSRNLLTKVLRDLEACAPATELPKSQPDKAIKTAKESNANQATQPASDLAQHLSAAEKILSARPRTETEEDFALDLQRAAGELWQDRSLFCKESPPSDRAVNTVMARIAE